MCSMAVTLMHRDTAICLASKGYLSCEACEEHTCGPFALRLRMSCHKVQVGDHVECNRVSTTLRMRYDQVERSARAETVPDISTDREAI